MATKKLAILAGLVVLTVLVAAVVFQLPQKLTTKLPEKPVAEKEKPVKEKSVQEEVPPEEMRIIGHPLWEFRKNTWEREVIPGGKVKMMKLGHASLLFESPQGKKILIDPSLSQNMATPEEFKNINQIGKVDYILITHSHLDHFNPEEVDTLYKLYEPTIIMEYDTWVQYAAQWPKAMPLTTGGAVVLDNIIFRMVNAEHTTGFYKEGIWAYGGAGHGFLIDFENGFKVYVAGDTAVTSELRDVIGKFYQPDVAIIPYSGGPFTLNLEEAAYAAYLVGAPKVVPYHYGFIPVLAPDASKFVEYMKANYPQFEVVVPKEGDWIEL